MKTNAQGRVPLRAHHRARAMLPFTGALDEETDDASSSELASYRRRLSPSVLQASRDAVACHASEAPCDAEGLLAWLEALRTTGPSEVDPLLDWLAASADETDLAWYVRQELAAQLGRADLTTAIANTGHTPPDTGQLHALAALLGLDLPHDIQGAWHHGMAGSSEVSAWASAEALARSNLIVALACNRRWLDHGFGALIAMAMTIPRRAAIVEAVLVRLGYEVFPPPALFNATAVVQLVRSRLATEPASARAVAEGALMWMRASVRCQEVYRERLVSDAEHAA